MRILVLLCGCVWFGSTFACFALAAEEAAGDWRLHQLQVIGTHNSYHIAPDDVANRLIKAFAPSEVPANDYTHLPLTQQLEDLHLRLFELDLFLDPRGELYKQPLAMKLAKQQRAAVAPFDPDGELARPGIKVLHSPDVDFRTTVYSLRAALREFKKWSDAHPRHVPIFVLLELKAESFSPFTKPLRWDAAALKSLEAEILAELPRDQILAPDDVRGSHAKLRDAILAEGWPKLSAARGKLVFLLDNEDDVRTTYLEPSDTLAGRLLFASVPRDRAAAAFMKRNDAVHSYDEIQQLVKSGFLVRTRADSNTTAARRNDTKPRERALASGAQLISTDFPQPDERFSDYVVRFPGNRAVRLNPLVDAGAMAVGQKWE